MSFRNLGLSDPLLAAVSDAGYTEPTPIQKGAIPSILMGRDILAIAQTGTGKTAGFTLPMIDILDQGRARARMPRSLILEPTRELAAQVEESFEKYGKNHKLSKTLLIGGVNFGDQEKALDRGVDVLIATPGRLLDHYQRGKLMLTGIDILVIDEADRMLDMGFIPDVEKICSLITKEHQTLFFSATMAPPIKKLVDQFLNNPKIVEVAKTSSTATTITQRVVHVMPRTKGKVLKDLIRSEDVKNGIIFCNRKVDVKSLFDMLKADNFSVGQLHGDMAQSDRTEMLKGFKENKVQLLVASDVAARGLDIPDVSHVFNYDLPSTAEDYVHRIGRTGRAGRKGNSFTLATKSKNDVKWLEAIEKLIDQKIEVTDLENPKKTPAKKAEKPEVSDKPVKESGEKPVKQAKKATPKKPSKAADKKLTDKKPAAKKADDKPVEKPAIKAEKRSAPKGKSTRNQNPKDAEKKATKPNNENAPRPVKDKRNINANDVPIMEDEQKVGLGDTIPAFLMQGLKK